MDEEDRREGELSSDREQSEYGYEGAKHHKSESKNSYSDMGDAYKDVKSHYRGAVEEEEMNFLERFGKRHKIHFIIGIIVLMLITIGVGLYIYAQEQRKEMTMSITLSHVTFQRKYMENNIPYATISCTGSGNEMETYFAEPKEVKFSSSEIFDAILPDQQYLTITVKILLTMRDANQMNIAVDADGEKQVDFTQILNNNDRIKKYCTIEYIKAV